MALVDEVQSRYSTELLVNWSNPQLSAATSIDSTRLSLAATDVQAEFKKKGLTYDNAVDTHVATAVEGVVLRLRVMTGHLPVDEWSRWKREDLQDLIMVTARDRIAPTTDSLLNPTKDRSNDKPWADRTQFRNFIPDSPARNSTTDGPAETTTD